RRRAAAALALIAVAGSLTLAGLRVTAPATADEPPAPDFTDLDVTVAPTAALTADDEVTVHITSNDEPIVPTELWFGVCLDPLLPDRPPGTGFGDACSTRL